MTDLDPALVERMVALVREMASKPDGGEVWRRAAQLLECCDEARTIVAELPKPIDPDLLEARGIVKATLSPDSHKNCRCRDKIDAGEWDAGQKVRATLAGLRRGRELAQPQPDGGHDA